jgi:hypothetical protein
VISAVNLPQNFHKIDPKETTVLLPQSEIQILFLKNDKEKYVEAYETNNLPCSEIIEHLNRGESVFISNKLTQRESEVKRAFIKPNESLYLNRI